MPVAHNFECPSGHVFERTVQAAYPIPAQKCPKCHKKAERVFLTPRQQRMARGFEPSVMFVNSDGHVVNPGRANLAGIPKKELNRLQKQGYKKVVIENFRQYESFCSEVSSKLRDQMQEAEYNKKQAYEQAFKQNIEQLRNGFTMQEPILNSYGEVVGTRDVKIPPLAEMHPMIREMAEIAIQRNSNYQERSINPNVFINSFENDRVSYKDQDTGWRRRY